MGGGCFSLRSKPHLLACLLKINLIIQDKLLDVQIKFKKTNKNRKKMYINNRITENYELYKEDRKRVNELVTLTKPVSGYNFEKHWRKTNQVNNKLQD